MRFWQGALRAATVVFAVFGLVMTGAVAVGLFRDIQAIDGTRGGYEPPYTDYTGEPVDWSRTDVTDVGMVYRGHVLHLLIDCSTGMMMFEIFGIAIPWREFSPRALVVHRPREACLERGFTPGF